MGGKRLGVWVEREACWMKEVEGDMFAGVLRRRVVEGNIYGLFGWVEGTWVVVRIAVVLEKKRVVS